MKQFLREYGVALVLIAIGLGGYLAYQQYEYEIKENVLAYSLDVIGARLVGLVDDPDSQQAIAARFDTFKQQVLNEQVSAEEVEHIAANVLNLSTSGLTLTPEQATLMLDLAFAPEAAPLPEAAAEAPWPTLAAPHPPDPPAPGNLEALGERLGAMLAFETRLQDAMKYAGAARHDLADHIRFRFEEGLHVDVDTALILAIGQQEYERMAQELEHLEQKRMVVWKAHVAAETQAMRERAHRVARSMESAHRPLPPKDAPDIAQSLASLEAMTDLEAKGVRVRVHTDSLRRLIQVQVKQAMTEGQAGSLEALDDYLEALEDEIEAAARAQEDAIEATIEAREKAHVQREQAVAHPRPNDES